jgi:hypothetical protein
MMMGGREKFAVAGAVIALLAACSAIAPAETVGAPREATPPISASDFCAQAQLSVLSWDLPPALAETVQLGTVTVSYRLPAGADIIDISLGVPVTPRGIDVREFFAAEPGSAWFFVAANLGVPNPRVIRADGFEAYFDGQEHRAEVEVLLPSERSYQRAHEWQWAGYAIAPFSVGDPEFTGEFVASGVHVRADRSHCRPIG